MNEEKNKTNQEKSKHFSCDQDGFLGRGYPPNSKTNLYTSCKKCNFVYLSHLKHFSKCGKLVTNKRGR